MDDARAREILDAAAAAEAARVSPDEAPLTTIRGVAAELPSAVEQLLAWDPAAALRLVGAVVDVWLDTGQVDVGRELTERVMAAVHVDEPSGSRPARSPAVEAALAWGLVAAAELAFRQGDQATAQRRSEQAIEIARGIGDTAAEAMAETFLARVAYRGGNAPEIEAHARRALELSGNHGMAHRGALHMLAWAAHTAGDKAEARRRFEASLDYRKVLGNRFAIAVELANLGDLSAESGDLGEAARQLTESLLISHQINSAYMFVNGLPSFAALAAQAGQLEDAARLFGAGDAASWRAALLPDPGTARAEEREAIARRLGGGRYESLTHAGAELPMSEAIALAEQVAESIARPA